jgi:hypothetical protein
MTPGAKNTLLDLAADEDVDLIVEGNQAYVGTRRTTVRVVNELLGVFALDRINSQGETPAYYTISSTGHSLIQRPELESELLRWMLKRPRRPFTIINNRVRDASVLERRRAP